MYMLHSEIEFHCPQVHWALSAGFWISLGIVSMGEQTIQIEATSNMVTFIDRLTSYIIHGSIHEYSKQHTQVWHLRDTSKASQTYLLIKNISNMVIRDGNNSININMLLSNCNIISNVNLNHHK